MSATELRRAFDEGDVAAATRQLRDDPSLTTALIEAPDIEPTSPLTYVGMARFYGYAQHNRTGGLAQALLDAGADNDDETNNGSPLICAHSHGDADVVRVLLNAGADVTLTDAPPETALRLAAAFGHPRLSTCLFRRSRAAVGDRGRRYLRPLRVVGRRPVGVRQGLRHLPR